MERTTVSALSYGNYCLSGACKRTDNLDLHVDLNQALRQRVDLDKTRIGGSRESSKLRDKTNVALCDTW